jgi:sugar phosphate isomerase/epimerase
LNPPDNDKHPDRARPDSGLLLFGDAPLILSAGTIPRARFPERVAVAREAGFDAISLFPQQYLSALKRERLTMLDMQAILAENNIRLDEVDPLLDWFGPTQSGSEQLMLEMAEGLGARSMNVAPAFVPDWELAQLREALSRVCERAARYRLRVDLEFLPWSLVPDLATALELLADCDQPNAGVMLDCWHFFRSGGQIADIERLNAEQLARISSIQVSDLPATPAPVSLAGKLALARLMLQHLLDGVRVHGAGRFRELTAAGKNHHPDAMALMTEAGSARLLPGQGDMPLADLLTALNVGGCRPSIGLEIFSLELASQPAADVAQRAMAAYQAMNGVYP